MEFGSGAVEKFCDAFDGVSVIFSVNDGLETARIWSGWEFETKKKQLEFCDKICKAL